MCFQKVAYGVIFRNIVVEFISVDFEDEYFLEQFGIVVDIKSVENNLNGEDLIIVVLYFVLKVVCLALRTCHRVYFEI